MRFRVTDKSYLSKDNIDKKTVKILQQFQYEEDKTGVFFGKIELEKAEDFLKLAKSLNKTVGVSQYGDLYIYG